MKTRLFGSNGRSLFAKNFGLFMAALIGSLLFSANSIAQITNQGSSSATTTSLTLTISKPAGLQVGDLMLLSILQCDNDGSTLGDPTHTGWTKITGATVAQQSTSLWRGNLAYRFATSSDVAASSFSFTMSANANNDKSQGAITVFRGVNTSNPFDVTPGSLSANSASTTLSATSQNSANINSAVVLFAFSGAAVSYSNWNSSTPGSLNEIYDLPNSTGIATSLGAAWRIKSPTGSTGTVSVSQSSSARGDAVMVILRQAISLSTDEISGPLCAGESISVPFTAEGTFANNNTFTAQLSNASGSFSSPTTIGTLANASTGSSINATIPSGQAAGSGYRIRVISSSPSITGSNNGANIQIRTLTAASAGSNVSMCETAASANITAGASATNALSVLWTSSGSGTFSNATSLTGATYFPSEDDILAGSVTLTLTATGNCNSPSSNKTLTFLRTPTASAGGSATICQGQAHVVSGASSSNGTISWTENGAGSITAGANTLTPTYTSAAGDAGNTVTLTMTVSNGSCTPATATYTIEVLGAAVANAGTAVSTCADAGAVNIAAGATATNSSAVLWSSNGTGTFENADSLSLATYTPSSDDILAGGVTLTLTAFGNSPCGNATSNKVLTINPVPSPVVIAPSSAQICPGGIVEISATGGVEAIQPHFTETFDGALSFTVSGTSAGADSAIFTQRTSPHSAVSTSFSCPDNSKFMLAHIGAFIGTANANTVMVSNPISTMGLTSLSLSFNHTYKKGNESGVSVQVSTNGSSWTTVKSYTANVGSQTSFVADEINLNAYVNQPNLRIRFNYMGNLTFTIAANGWWAIDQVVLNAPKPSMVWSPQAGLYTDAAATVPYSGGLAPKVYAKPSGTTVYTATSTSVHGCGSSENSITVTVHQTTLGGVSQAATVCQDSAATIQLSGMIPGSVSDISYAIGAGPVQTALSVSADESGNASFNVNLALANNGQTLAITSISRKDVSPVCSFVPSSNNTVVLGVNANVTYYADADSDSYGNPAVSQVSCFGAPEGYVADNTDCNDDDSSVHAKFDFYVDADQDGFGSGSLVSVCAVDAETPPSGYSLNNTDCNDADASAHAEFPFFADADGDGFGSGDLQNVCAVDANTPPAGYSLDGSDCNDADNYVHAEYEFYVDADGDGFGTGDLVSVCAVNENMAPSGYSVYNTDCNDSIAAINPGQAEVLYNGVDDNCDGNLDEGHQLLSQVLQAQCGTTLTTLSSVIGAVSFGGPVNGYRFEVTNTETNAVQVIDCTVPHFQLTQLATYDYATTYSIRVMLRRNGIWLGYYGPSCLVSTPAILDPGGSAQVSPSQCGITLPSISTLIATTSLPGVTAYKFKVTNLLTNSVQTIDRNLHWFSLTMLEEFTYGTTYMVEVAVKTNGVFSGFGSPCQVSSPPVPQINQCDSAIPTKGTLISTLSLNRVTSYRFEVTDMSTLQVNVIDRSTNWFNFHHVSSYTPGGLMAVRVAVMTAGAWSDFGEACFITAPGAARTMVQEDAVPEVAFRVVSYPNPYVDTFSLDVDLPTEEKVEVKIYDMLGKIVETRSFEAIDTEMQTFGSKFSAGVYNIVVSQGSNVKTLRIVKR